MTAPALGAPAPDPGAGEVVQTAHSGDFLRLTRLWLHRTHFSLLFAAFDNPAYRDGLIQRLNTVQPGLRMELAATDTPQDWLARLQAATQVGEKRVHTLLPARGSEDTTRWWQQANVLRERLADAFPAIILVWLSDADIDTAAHQAPDLWNWREAVFTFTDGISLNLFQRVRPPIVGSQIQAAREAQARGNVIAQYLRQADIHAVESAYLHLEAAQIHERLSQWTQSEADARAAARAFQMSNHEQMAAQAQSQLAHVLRFRGKADEALHILQDELLPTFERLGDVRSKAITMGQIADILQSRGQMDEALRIRQEEQLPVFERLGDVGAKAITMGQIADILQSRGQLDEALTIWQTECLPVFERLGLTRETAIANARVMELQALVREKRS